MTRQTLHQTRRSTAIAWLLGMALLCAGVPATATQLVVPAGATLTLPSGVLGLACANLTVQGSMNAGAAQVGPTGTVTISGALDAGASTITVGGSWLNSGTFTAGTSTVVFADGCTTANAVLTGNTTFAKLTFTSTLGRTFVLPTGSTTSVTVLLTLTGAAGTPIQIVSADPSVATTIVLGSGATVSSTNVQLGTNVAIGSGAGALALAPTTLAFGGQSMGTTSPAMTVTVTNTGGAPVAVSAVATDNAQFTQTNNCTTLAPAASCTVNVSFSPAAVGGALNFTAPVSGNLSVASNATGSPNSAGLTGTAEKSLVTHYYRSILRRAPDAGGFAFWSGEAGRVATAGANVNETWFALAGAFYASPEYTAQNRNTTEYVRDLYNTFYNRAADDGGLDFWTGQIASGLPREVVLVAFMFSPEFANFTGAIFGNTAVRAEVNTVVDFYRGLLGRLPDDGGFVYWRDRFRAAQCQGAAAVTNEVEAISSAYALSGEYAGRNRDNTQYVTDLYNAFLRRGGDLGGFQFWVGQVASGARSREQVRLDFKNSPEFQARVSAIIAEGCLP